MRNAAMILAASIASIAAVWNPNRLSALQLPATAAATAPSTEPVGGSVSLNATITSVKGIVQVRGNEGDPWQPAKVGMKLAQGAEFRTGLRSAVQFVIEPDQIITLDRLGTVKVLQAVLDRNKVTTDLGVKYGRTRYDIQAADLEHQSTIHSPGSTLSIRGTDITYEDQVPWVPTAVSRHGRAEFQDFKHQIMPFGGTKKAVVAADKNGPAQQALVTTRIDPRSAFAGRSQGEENLQINLASSGGIDAQGVQILLALAKFQGFAPARIGIPTVPGPLEFDLIWQSTLAQPNPTNLDFLVTDPSGHVLSVANPTSGKGTSQGMFTGNDLGQSGSGGESVVWAGFYPVGKYKVQAINRSGDPAQAFITVNQGQSAVAIKTFGVEPQAPIILKPGQSYTGTVSTKLVMSPKSK